MNETKANTDTDTDTRVRDAAPELLVALRMLFNETRNVQAPSNEALEAAEKALIKATGEDP